MRSLNIYSKPRRGRAILIQTMEVAADFDAAVAACDAYRATIEPTVSKIFWNWADSAWDRVR
jgi:hypothetical protein